MQEHLAFARIAFWKGIFQHCLLSLHFHLFVQKRCTTIKARLWITPFADGHRKTRLLPARETLPAQVISFGRIRGLFMFSVSGCELREK